MVAGFSPGPKLFQSALLGAPYASPLTAAREYIVALRGLLDGQEVMQQGEYVSLHGGQPRVPPPPVSLGLGVLRPRMARLAGEIADVTPEDEIRLLCRTYQEGNHDTRELLRRMATVAVLERLKG